MIIKIITYTISVVMLSISHCDRGIKSKNATLRSITLISHLEIVKPDNGQLIRLNDSLIIFYYENFILLQAPYIKESSHFITDKNNNVIDQKWIKTETKYEFFVYKKDDAYGHSFNSLKAQSSTKLLVDSFLAEKAYANVKFYDNTNDTLIKTVKEANNDILLETYIPKFKYDRSYSDTTYLYYSEKFRDIDYSFSKELDSIKNRKLFKVRFIYNPISKGIYPFEVPRREFLFELKETAKYNSKEIMEFFKNFNMPCGKLKN